MIDYDLLERMENGSYRSAPPSMPTWKYVSFILCLQFGPLILLAALVLLCGKIFE